MIFWIWSIDITLEEIVVHLQDTFGLKTSKSFVDRFFSRHNMSFKKRQRMPVSEASRRKGKARKLV